MTLESLTEKIRSLVKTAGKELVDVALIKEQNEAILRVTIESIDVTQNITIDDCTKVSYLLSPFLDVEDPFSFPYSLEVSSPGSYRELKTDADLERFLKSDIKIRFKEKEKASLVGSLIAYTQESILIQKEDTEINIDRSQIRKISLRPSF